MNIQENCFLAVCGDLRSLAELTTNSMRTKSSWICLSISFSLPCINPQVLIGNVSWNQWKSKSSQTWVWTSQVFSSLLTWSNKHFAVSSYGKEEEGRKSWGLSLSCLLTRWLSKGLATFCQNVSLNKNSKQIFCYCLFHDVHLLMVDLTELCTEL